MKNLVLMTLLFMGCSTLPSDSGHQQETCFLLYDLKARKFEKIIGEEHCRKRYPAYSTFKVPLAVMAFDSGALKDEKVVLRWDGVKGPRQETNRDHNAKTWMRDSVVWFSQRLTARMGEKKLQEYLDKFDYGNKNLEEGILTAWITSPVKKGKGLEISAFEQVEFMKKLWTGKLPVTERAMKLAREITFLEKTPKGYSFSGKTGSNFFDKERKIHSGWFISHLKNDNQEYIAVTNIRDLKPFDGGGYGGMRAKALTQKFLEELGLW